MISWGSFEIGESGETFVGRVFRIIARTGCLTRMASSWNTETRTNGSQAERWEGKQHERVPENEDVGVFFGGIVVGFVGTGTTS